MFSSSGNVSHTVILHPLSSGVYNISWASLSYVFNEEGQEKVKLLITIIVIMIIIIMAGTIIKAEGDRVRGQNYNILTLVTHFRFLKICHCFVTSLCSNNNSNYDTA